MGILIKNISGLIQVENIPREFFTGNNMAGLSIIKDAYLIIKDGIISDFGEMKNLNYDNSGFNHSQYGTIPVKIFDASGKYVFPSFCDSHTHLVYAGSRENEFVDWIKGLSYKDITGRGGGIQNSSARLQNTSENDLYYQSMERINEIIGLGTGAVEIKSGYGLPVALASDFNPGSSPSGNMKLIMSLGCMMLKMFPEEVINAVTINSAYAMGLSETHGSIARGKVANVFITKKIPSYEFMPYAFGSNLIKTAILKGEIIV